MMLQKETREALMDFDVDPETVEWITVEDYLNAPQDEVIAIHDIYRTFHLAFSDNDKIFIVPKADFTGF